MASCTRYLSVCVSQIYNTRLAYVHGKNDFAKASKNLARYRFENNFVWIKIIM